MATLGPTTERTYGAEWFGGGYANQHCAPETMPEDGRITRIGVWCRGKDASTSFRGVVWSSTRNTVLGQTASQTASSAPFAIGNSLKYEAAVLSPFDVASGVGINIGFTRNPSSAMQFSFNNTASHYDDYTTSSTPSAMSGEVLHSPAEPAFYVVYETIPELYVRRSGVWSQVDALYTRRSGAWSNVGPDLYVRRSGAWSKV